MIPTQGYAVKSASSKFEPFNFERRELKEHDVLIKILYCGICHSDIHQARNEWGGSAYPMVPGHEIVGRVERVGSKVKNFKAGDLAGVGCFVDSCRVCESCKDHEEQFCETHLSLSYNSTEQDKKTPTFGGYSSQIVVDEKYVLKVSPKLPLANVAPLLCAGITTYSPLRFYNVKPGQKVGVIGLGGLGHMAVKLAASMGAEVTVFSRSDAKEKDAHKLGAKKFVVTKDPKNLESLANSFDLIIDAVSAPHDPNMYLRLLKKDGVLVMIGAPDKPLEVQASSLIEKRRKMAGTLIGGIRETQEMLDYCAEKGITSDIELIPIQDIEKAYERTIKGDVKYRFVIDMSSLPSA
jgi:alcohol dehydrogenase (NADP+)